MMDPNWSRGFYYDRIPPHAGMKLAREIATITYRSGPEWEQRFGRRRADPRRPPALCPDFLIETYLDHAGEKFCLEYDPNSLLYVSKAMDLFDLGQAEQARMAKLREENRHRLTRQGGSDGASADSGNNNACNLVLPDTPYEEQPSQTLEGAGTDAGATDSPPTDLVEGLAPMRNHKTLVMGVDSDILFPAWQQREIAETLRRVGNKKAVYVELGKDVSLFGHDTFLLDTKHVGGPVKAFLEG
jgi:homoserine O-acetyltransferase